MKIGIAGCGGIGSNIACHLVRTGINYLKFGDFDKIEVSFFSKIKWDFIKAKHLQKILKL